MPLVPILPFARDAKKLSRDEFIAQHPDPVLMVNPFRSIHDTGFETKAADGSEHGSTITVARIRKRPGSNAFAQMITIGRAGNNDIEIKGSGVSKFHAYLSRGPGGQVLIVDGGSTFGTLVGDHELVPRTDKVPLKSGDVIRFGDAVVATFHDPAGFYDCLLAASEWGRVE